MTPTWVLPTVIGASFLISLITQLINFKLTDQKYIKAQRAKMKDLQKKIGPNSSKKEIEDAQSKIMSINSELMRHTMKPTMYTMVPLLLVFALLSHYFKPYGDLIQLPFSLPLFGTAISWLGTYVLSSFIFSLVLKPLITKVSDYYEK